MFGASKFQNAITNCAAIYRLVKRDALSMYLNYCIKFEGVYLVSKGVPST